MPMWRGLIGFDRHERMAPPDVIFVDFSSLKAGQGEAPQIQGVSP